MAVHKLDDANFAQTRVLCRVDYNVPLKDGDVADGFRIAASLPTLEKVLADGGALILMSHLGRPKGRPSDALRMAPVGRRLSQLIGKPVKVTTDCVGPEAEAACSALEPGGIVLLENLRFHAEEQASDEAFGKRLADLATAGGAKGAFVSDAFGTAHRPDASMTVPPRHLPAYAGYLLASEIRYLGQVLEAPQKPLVAVLGGAKVSDKIPILESLSRLTDAICIGGAMAYTFLAARGVGFGASLCERGRVDAAGRILEDCQARGVRVVLPTDHVVADRIDADAGEIVTEIVEGMAGFDIGPDTRQAFAREIASARTVLFNGPPGVFENAPFAAGTRAVCAALATTGATTIVGGGDAVAAVRAFEIADKLTHVSTGGGASLEFLEGKTLPGIAALDR